MKHINHVDCPLCGEPLDFFWINEMQGDSPMQGMVTFLDDYKQNCDCDLDESVIGELINKAALEEVDK